MKKKFFSAIKLGTCISVLLISQMAQADQLADIKVKGEVVCGTLGVTRGLSFMDQNERVLRGYEVDLCAQIAQSLGVRPVMKVVTAAARIPELQQGRIDLVLGKLAYTQERALQIDYSYPYHFLTTKIMVKTDSGIQNFEQLAGQKIATPKGGTQEEVIRTQLPQAQLLSFDTLTQAFLAFTQDKAAAFVADEETLASNRHAMGEKAKELTVLPTTLMVEYIGAGVRKGETSLVNQINTVFTNYEKSGEAETTFLKWFGPNTETGFKQRDFKIDGSGDIPKDMKG